MTLALRPQQFENLAHSERKLRIGLLCPHDLTDRNAFSGTAYFAAEALADLPEIELVPIAPPPRALFQKILRRPQKLRPPSAKDFQGIDVVVGLVASRLVSFLPADLPFLHVTDATPAFLRETYGWDLSTSLDETERLAVARADQVIYSSAAMAARAPRDLGLEEIHSAVLPFGVNFEMIPAAIPEKPPLERPRLLFVGSQWGRKGGEIALEAFDNLRSRGIDAHLTLVGQVPETIKPRAGLRIEGYLNKNRVGEATRLSQLYAESHLLILPTRGDCTPMVIAEAMAHGTPVLTTNVGGTRDMIGGAGAGQVLSLSAGAEDWATAIIHRLESHSGFDQSSRSAFNRAHDKLSWAAWARGISVLARATVNARTLSGSQLVA